MAITITQTPGAVRLSLGEIAFAVTSTNSTNVNFSFIADLYEGTTFIKRVFKQPNPTGSGVFDLSRIIDDQLNYDIAPLGATSTTLATNAIATYTVRFGERFRATNNGAVATTPTLTPNLTTSSAFTVLKGVQIQNLYAPTDAIHTIDRVLSVIPDEDQRVHIDDTATISYFDESADDIIHQPINIPGTAGRYIQSVNGTSYAFDVYSTRSPFGETRFAWVNDAGGYDYFNADQEHEVNVNVSKQSYDQTTLAWGRTTLSNRATGNSNAFIGGTTNYQTEVSTINTSQTRWLSESESLLLEGLFKSPFVHRYDRGQWIPVLILNNAYPKQRVTRRITNFQYPIQWRDAANSPTR